MPVINLFVVRTVSSSLPLHCHETFARFLHKKYSRQECPSTSLPTLPFSTAKWQQLSMRLSNLNHKINHLATVIAGYLPILPGSVTSNGFFVLMTSRKAATIRSNSKRQKNASPMYCSMSSDFHSFPLSAKRILVRRIRL